MWPTIAVSPKGSAGTGILEVGEHFFVNLGQYFACWSALDVEDDVVDAKFRKAVEVFDEFLAAYLYAQSDFFVGVSFGEVEPHGGN